jgi:hypothetical protein
MRLVIRLIYMRATVEDSVDLSGDANILFDDVSQEEQLGLQAVLITDSSGSLNHSR